MIMYNTIFILLSHSSGGEAVFVGLVIGIITMIVSWLYNKSKSVAGKISTTVKLQINPNDIKSLINKAYDELGSKNFDSAISLFDKALSLENNNLDALAGIAFGYHLIKDYVNSKACIEKYQNTITADTANHSMAGVITYLHGHHLFMEGDFEGANIGKKNGRMIASLSNNSSFKTELNN